MKDLIVFSIGSNKYAIGIENIRRIIPTVELTSIPNAHKSIEGIISYEDSVIKVLSFRNIIGIQNYDEELHSLFLKLKASHSGWMDSLKRSLDTGSAFTGTFDPHMCDLGKWIDGFTSYDEKVSILLGELVKYHKLLHTRSAKIFDISIYDKEEAKLFLDTDINNIYNYTMEALDAFILELDTVANSLQKLLIYENKGETFAIKVDKIEDIAHIHESEIMNGDSEEGNYNFLELEGVLDLEGVLINVIKTVSLPK